MVFKQCPLCEFQWATREEFLCDPDLELIGYQVRFKHLSAGIMLFNHVCKTTMAVRVVAFQDLYDGPIFDQRATDTPSCPGHCLHQDDLEPCPEQCECAFVREIVQQIKAWPKCAPTALKKTNGF